MGVGRVPHLLGVINRNDNLMKTVKMGPDIVIVV